MGYAALRPAAEVVVPGAGQVDGRLTPAAKDASRRVRVVPLFPDSGLLPDHGRAEEPPLRADTGPEAGRPGADREAEGHKRPKFDSRRDGAPEEGLG